MPTIQSIKARQILDSRGNPTIEVDVTTNNGKLGRASVPSGASTGSREALELRDNNPKLYMGKSVLIAVDNVNKKIAGELIGRKVSDQRAIDQLMIEMDGSESKSNLGANAILGVSLALARAGAAGLNLPLFRYLRETLDCPNQVSAYRLPMPMMNLINGGAHASNNLDIQEFMIVPHLKASFSRNLQAGVEIFHNLKKALSQAGYSTNVGDEGGFAPDFKNHQEAITFLLKAIEMAGYRAGEDISLALDAASSEFWDEKTAKYKMEGKLLTSGEMIEYYSGLCSKFPIYSIEDGLAEGDHESWPVLTKKIGNKVKIIGDDLFVTNKKILAQGIKDQEANAILIKVNQIGSLTETFETMDLAFKSAFVAVISHRSGETGDAFIADLAVATGAGHIKTGSASRSDRIEKYNQLLRIEEALGNQARFDGIS